MWLWLMDGSPRLGPETVSACEAAAAEGRLLVCSVSLWEVAALHAFGRLTLAVPVAAWLRQAVDTPGLTVVSIDPEVADESLRLPGAFSGDSVDRILVATARTTGSLFLTADPGLLSYARQGHLRAIGVSGSTGTVDDT